jgi:hypothetical protein
MGRPAWIPDQDAIEKVESLAARGMTKEQIADCLGIHYDTLNEKCKTYAEFSDAIKRGTAKGIANVTAALMRNVSKDNVTAQIFYLKCKGDWKEAKDGLDTEDKSLMQKLIDKL